MNIKLLIEQNFKFLSFKGGCKGWSEYIHVRIPHCWKSHVAVHISLMLAHEILDHIT